MRDMIDAGLLDILACPSCRGGVRRESTALACQQCGARYDVVDGVPIFAHLESLEPDVRLSRGKWQRQWQGLNWDAARADYATDNLPYIYRHLPPPARGQRFLEIGSGPGFLAFDMARRGADSVCLDLDIDVLRLAKRNAEASSARISFVCGNMNQLPFRTNVFDVSAGIGVLEHSRSIETTVRELARVTRTTGLTFQTVPYCSLLTLVNASLRFGTIPRMPVLRQLVELLHLRLLGARYMRCGYEESYTYRFLGRAFERAGFSRPVDVGFYEYDQTLFRRRRRIARLFQRLIRLRVLGTTPFADIAYVKAHR
jgi:ubiquinone/menaquinone biosynthesis C-methylase UbiE/uncharacterized protein YbaR (Trm112 family)